MFMRLLPLQTALIFFTRVAFLRAARQRNSPIIQMYVKSTSDKISNFAKLFYISAKRNNKPDYYKLFFTAAAVSTTGERPFNNLSTYFFVFKLSIVER